ncbi:unnamed protein product [Arctogadus glacialis]
MAGESGSVTPLEHVGAEGGWNEQAVRGAGTGGWQIKGGGPYLLLNLPGDSSDKAGGRNNGGGFSRLIRIARDSCFNFFFGSPFPHGREFPAGGESGEMSRGTSSAP